MTDRRLEFGVFVDSYVNPRAMEHLAIRLPEEAVKDGGYVDLSFEVRKYPEDDMFGRTTEVVIHTDNIPGEVNIVIVDGRGNSHEVFKAPETN